MNNKQKEKIVTNHCNLKEFCKLVYTKLKIQESYRVWYNDNHKELKEKYNAYKESQIIVIDKEIKKILDIKLFKQIGTFSLILSVLFALYYYTL